MFGLGIGELLLVFLAVLVIFGPKRIPEFAKALADAMRSFRNATDDIKREVWEAGNSVDNPLKEIENEIADTGKSMKKELDDFGSDLNVDHNTASSENISPTKKESEADDNGPVSR